MLTGHGVLADTKGSIARNGCQPIRLNCGSGLFGKAKITQKSILTVDILIFWGKMLDERIAM